jgi:hypothetical protein
MEASDVPVNEIEDQDAEITEEIPPEVEEEIPEPEPAGEQLGFFQRSTVGFNWNPATIGSESEEVAIDAWVPADPTNFDGDGSWRNVRTVPNMGSSSVTYPSDFSGPVRLRVRGTAGAVPGDYTVS